MAENIDLSQATYALLNATDVKEYLIRCIESSDNPAFKDVRYTGSNMNAVIDTLAVIFQQMMFHFSLNTSESTFSSAQLYESMNKLVSILNYKTIGKQTSMLPVRITVKNISKFIQGNVNRIIIPKFLSVSHNSSYILKNELVYDVDRVTDTAFIDTILFQGSVQISQEMQALGDEFETFVIQDDNIGINRKFISDNFFIVFVKDGETGKYTQYTETSSLYLEDERAQVYERRFNENQDYEFKFGNGVYGRKLKRGDSVVIFYLLSSGEDGIISDGLIQDVVPTLYQSSTYSRIMNNLASEESDGIVLDATTLRDGTRLIDNITISSFGPSTAISYPESVESMRINAPKIFASQNRLFSLHDYKTFIMKNFGQYCKDVYMCTNDTYTRNFLRYYYQLGIDRPQKDARINLSQVEFQTSCNFNNVYCFIVPKVNTVISGKIPNYLNTTIKQEIVNACDPYKGTTHNLVPMDPIYKAVTFGSSYLQSDDFEPNQLYNQLYLVRDRLSKYSFTYIKEQAVAVINDFFGNLMLGYSIDVSALSKQLSSIPGVKRFYIKDVEGNVEPSLTLYTWNPLYSNEDHEVTQQNILVNEFTYQYFYDIDNVEEKIIVEDE